MTREEIESALDARMLQIKAFNRPQWYDIRRNGATKLWKTRPKAYRIPCKVGSRECFYLEPGSHQLRLRPNNFNSRTRE